MNRQAWTIFGLSAAVGTALSAILPGGYEREILVSLAVISLTSAAAISTICRLLRSRKPAIGLLLANSAMKDAAALAAITAGLLLRWPVNPFIFACLIMHGAMTIAQIAIVHRLGGAMAASEVRRG